MQYINNLFNPSREGYVELTTSLTDDYYSDDYSVPIKSRPYMHIFMNFVSTLQISTNSIINLLCSIPKVQPFLRDCICSYRYRYHVRFTDVVSHFKSNGIRLRMGNCYINSKNCDVIIVELDTCLLVHPFTKIEKTREYSMYRISNIHYKFTSVPTKFIEYNNHWDFLFC